LITSVGGFDVDLNKVKKRRSLSMNEIEGIEIDRLDNKVV
jgi:hypothetical protein